MLDNNSIRKRFRTALRRLARQSHIDTVSTVDIRNIKTPGLSGQQRGGFVTAVLNELVNEGTLVPSIWQKVRNPSHRHKVKVYLPTLR